MTTSPVPMAAPSLRLAFPHHSQAFFDDVEARDG
jgi:hypothetical protein